MGKLVDSTIMHDPHLEFTRELAWLVYKRLIKICMVGAASGDLSVIIENVSKGMNVIAWWAVSDLMIYA